MNPFLCCLMTLLFVTHAYGSAQQVREEEESPLIQEKPTQLRCDEYDFTPIDGREKISFLKTLSAVCLKVTKESKAPRNLCSMEKDTLKAVMINHPCALEIAGCAYVFVNVESLNLSYKLANLLKSSSSNISMIECSTAFLLSPSLIKPIVWIRSVINSLSEAASFALV